MALRTPSKCEATRRSATIISTGITRFDGRFRTAWDAPGWPPGRATSVALSSLSDGSPTKTSGHTLAQRHGPDSPCNCSYRSCDGAGNTPGQGGKVPANTSAIFPAPPPASSRPVSHRRLVHRGALEDCLLSGTACAQDWRRQRRRARRSIRVERRRSILRIPSHLAGRGDEPYKYVRRAARRISGASLADPRKSDGARLGFWHRCAALVGFAGTVASSHQRSTSGYCSSSQTGLGWRPPSITNDRRRDDENNVKWPAKTGRLPSHR